MAYQVRQAPMDRKEPYSLLLSNPQVKSNHKTFFLRYANSTQIISNDSQTTVLQNKINQLTLEVQNLQNICQETMRDLTLFQNRYYDLHKSYIQLIKKLPDFKNDTLGQLDKLNQSLNQSSILANLQKDLNEIKQDTQINIKTPFNFTRDDGLFQCDECQKFRNKLQEEIKTVEYLRNELFKLQKKQLQQTSKKNKYDDTNSDISTITPTKSIYQEGEKKSILEFYQSLQMPSVKEEKVETSPQMVRQNDPNIQSHLDNLEKFTLRKDEQIEHQELEKIGSLDQLYSPRGYVNNENLTSNQNEYFSSQQTIIDNKCNSPNFSQKTYKTETLNLKQNSEYSQSQVSSQPAIQPRLKLKTRAVLSKKQI